jgi:hypothetical protein
MRKLIEMISPLIITDEMGFTSYCDMTDEIDEDYSDNTQRRVYITDSEGDGIIEASWTKENYGVAIKVTDMMGEVVVACMKKTELKIFVEMLNAALEIELEELKERVALRKNND